MKKVMVSKEDSWKLDTSMFCLEGNWETGYLLDKDIFFMVGVKSYCEVGESCSYLALKVGPRARLLVVKVSPGRYNMYLQEYNWCWEPDEEPTQSWHNLTWSEVMDLALNTKM
jgi:hypothetical protein